MGIVRDLYYARKMGAGLKLPAPSVALLIKRLALSKILSPAVLKTVTGALLHITDALAKPAKELLVDLTAIQSGSGTPSPDNVRPISGRTGLTVYRMGKNFANFPTNQQLPTSASGVEVLDVGYDMTVANCTLSFFLNNAVYSSSSGALVDFLKNDGTHQYRLCSAYGMTANTPNTGTFSKSENSITFRKVIVFSGTTYANFSAGTMSVQLEFSSSSSAFEPYAGSTYTSDWTSTAGTVYGGSLDLVTGVLTVDRKIVNLGDYDWTYDSTYTRFQYTSTDIKNMSARTLPMQCSALEPIYDGRAIGSVPDNSVYSGGMVVNVKYSAAGGNTAAFKTAMNGVQLCYPLGSPYVQTYQLTAQEVDLLLGENYLWCSDGADLQLTYYADGNANTIESLNLLLGNRYVNNHTPEDVEDKEALEILLGGNK